ncbi:MAG: SIR2 family protein, partial [Dehalococcoidia bacterium]|nr:SIR2 family protein [Dehalococcoidia bacterium]
MDAFLMQVEEWLAANPATVNGRERPLVGLPVVGTGAGGGQLTKGSIVDQLVKYLAARAAAAPFDVVLVVRGSRMHAAVEYSRRAATATRSVTSALSPELEAAAKELARRANKGELVLFLGAGVSMGAGLPGWNGLLGSLAESAGLQAAESESLSRMSHLDQAHLISRRLEQLGKDLGTSVKEQLAASNYSLSHSLLASLPVREVATTNYDQLFECASSDAGTPAAVLPYAANRNRERWLLKLHGCVTQPQDIVLTRSDYLRYAERRAALAGIVQALLITKHMLFVGFSLTDENFHRIADDVRRAMSGQGQSDLRCGTAMVLSPDPLMAELWLPEIACTPVSEGGGATRAAARELEIFLDRVLAECTDMTSHILDDTFEHLLSPGELE